MQIKHGIPVSPGLSISRAVIMDAEDLPVPRRVVETDEIQKEHDKLQAGIQASINELNAQREQTRSDMGSDLAEIFGFHLGMLHDRSLIETLHRLIQDDQVSAEYSVYSVMREEARKFKKLDNPIFRERYKDVWDLERRLLSHLIPDRQSGTAAIGENTILLAHDLTPSQTASLDKNKVKGLATEAGGRTSHTAILAHGLGIPAVVGIEDLLKDVQNGDTLILDGYRGQIIINPDAARIHDCRNTIKEAEKASIRLAKIRNLPAETQDGHQLELLANIEFPTEIPSALEHGATGVGLYRTEFLFLASENSPGEDEQLAVYKEALKELNGKTLTIRTLDLGADKLKRGLTDSSERNPFLGCRSIRLCLQNLPLFKTQLRAILRASADGPIRIMFPLISGVMELRQAKMILHDVMEDLRESGIEFDPDIPLGIMIEVPSAAIQADLLAQEVDFFSIGTNDLIQYTLAVDRGNERVADLYTGAHPAVLHLIHHSLKAGNKAGIDVSLCGEMGGEVEFTMLLVGMGLKKISMTSPAIPEVKEVIRSTSYSKCTELAEKILKLESDRAVHTMAVSALREAAPKVFYTNH